MARAIAREVEIVLEPADEANAGGGVDPDAYEAFLKGVHFLKQSGAKNHLKAVEFLEQAVAVEPDFAPAWAALADGYT